VKQRRNVCGFWPFLKKQYPEAIDENGGCLPVSLETFGSGITAVGKERAVFPELASLQRMLEDGSKVTDSLTTSAGSGSRW